jgi:hypothetical protein
MLYQYKHFTSLSFLAKVIKQRCKPFELYLRDEEGVCVVIARLCLDEHIACVLYPTASQVSLKVHVCFATKVKKL